MTFNVILVDRETQKMGIPELLAGYAVTTLPREYTMTEEELLQYIPEADAIIGVFGRVSQRAIATSRKLKIIAVAAAGFDNVDVKAATEKGIHVTRAANASVEGVAEHALGLMICLGRKVTTFAKEVGNGNWGIRDSGMAFGNELIGKTVGVMGIGKVGSTLVRKLNCLGMKVIATDPYQNDAYAQSIGARLVGLDDLLRQSDFICITSSLTSETKHLIGPRELAMMKPNAFLVNVARGGIIDEAALFKSLSNHQLAGAGLDVMEKEPPESGNPLFSLSNCIITPHVAGLTVERYHSCGSVAVGEVKKVLGGAEPTPDNRVNRELNIAK